ncbi:MAG: solute-binding protein [Eubacteriales bacterium]|nr:solute-binding protein [Eubacteriales bacterium]
MHIRRILLNMLMFLLKMLMVLAIAAGIAKFGGYAYDFGHSIYDNSSVSDPPGKDVTVVIPDGCSVSRAAELLAAKGLIKDAWVFIVQEKLSKYRGQIQSGNFVLNTSQNGQEMLAILSGHEEDIQDGEEE